MQDRLKQHIKNFQTYEQKHASGDVQDNGGTKLRFYEGTNKGLSLRKSLFFRVQNI